MRNYLNGKKLFCPPPASCLTRKERLPFARTVTNLQNLLLACGRQLPVERNAASAMLVVPFELNDPKMSGLLQQ